MDYTNLHTPTEMAEARIRLAVEYSEMSNRLIPILRKKPMAWLLLRQETKSDTAATRKWEMTPDGIEETVLELQMKANDKMQNALSSRIHVATLEVKNLL